MSCRRVLTGGLDYVQEVLSLGELCDLDKLLLHVRAGSAHHAHRQEQVVLPQEVPRQPYSQHTHTDVPHNL